jgi:hypothetical protein
MKLNLTLLAILLLYHNVIAQVNESFADGNFSSNPVWTGNTNAWLVSSNLLKLNSSGTDTSFLFTQNGLNYNTEWMFTVTTQFSPSGSNLNRIYVCADTFQKNMRCYGYFLSWGETGNLDSYDLYRQDSNLVTKILDGIDARANFSSNTVVLRITRDQANVWKVYSKNTGEGSFTLEGQVHDDTYFNSKYVGLWPKYTSTNAKGFSYDDIIVQSLWTDTQGPKVATFSIVNDTSIQITFNEPIDITTIQSANIQLNGAGNSIKSLQLNRKNFTALQLITSSKLPEDTVQLTLIGIKDRAGNSLDTALKQFYVPPYQPQWGDIIVSEFFPDPSPSVGLPTVEFIEIYNRTRKAIALKNWKLSDATSSVSFGEDTIPAFSYLLLCNKTDSAQFVADSVQILTFPSLPSLNNSSDQIKIFAFNGLLVDSLSYNLDWYKSTAKLQGGYSIECIDVLSSCRSISNFKASEHLDGGTPGLKNSVEILGTDTIPISIDSVQTADKLLKVFLNLSLSNELKPSQISILQNNQISSAQIDSIKHSYNQSFTLYLSNFQYNTTYTLHLDSLQACGNDSVYSIKANLMIFRNETSKGKLVFNEIFPDPSPQVALPLSEFVEIKNISSDTINLKGLTYHDPLSSYTFNKDYLIFPNALIVLVNQAERTNFAAYDSAKIMGISPWPGLNNSSDSLWITNALGDTIAFVNYKDSWYKDSDKKTGGYSLERICSASSCDSIYNYVASKSALGGTIAQENSVASDSMPIPFVYAIKFVSPTQVEINIQNSDFLVLNAIQATISDNSIDSMYWKSNKLYLMLADSLALFKAYEINLNNVIVCGIDSVFNLNKSETYNLNVAQQQSLIITEIMIDPSPVIGLPEAEFIEIYNTTDSIINTQGFSLNIDGSIKPIPTLELHPQSYYLIAASSHCAWFADSTQCLGITGFKALNNTSGTIQLLDEANFQITKLDYHVNWHINSNAKNGGYSLERRNISDTCNLKYNWSTSINALGGTPFLPNSIKSDEHITLKAKSFEIKDKAIQLQLNKSLVNHTDSYQVIFKPSSFTVDSIKQQDSLLSIFFNPEIPEGTSLSISIANIQTCNETPFSTEKTFLKGFIPNTNDILFSEILPNPYQGWVEFIELYNASEHFFDLKELYISDLAFKSTQSKHPLSNSSIFFYPNTYKVMCIDSLKVQNFYHFAPNTFVQLNSMPSLNNDEDALFILTKENLIIDSLYYSDKMHLPLLNDEQGVSLERVELSKPSNATGNWYSAASQSGFATPGLANSQQKSENPQQNKVILINPEVFSPDGDGFDDALSIQLSEEAVGKVVDIVIYDPNGNKITSIATKELYGNGVYYAWNGFNAQNLELPIGVYFVLAKIYEHDGSAKTYYLPVILARKLN